MKESTCSKCKREFKYGEEFFTVKLEVLGCSQGFPHVYTKDIKVYCPNCMCEEAYEIAQNAVTPSGERTNSESI